MNPRVSLLAILFAALAAVLVWFANRPSGTVPASSTLADVRGTYPALDTTIVLNGTDGRHGPMQLTLNSAATLTSCGGREDRVTRCVLVDTEREADVMADLVAQLGNSGWASREPGPGAAPGLRVFSRAGDSDRCPHLVLIIPRSAPRGAKPAPAGNVYFTIGYAPDARCWLGLRH